MNKISCGVIIRDFDRMLVARPTNHKLWNIPKGIEDPMDLDYYTTAIREAWEETNIDLLHYLDNYNIKCNDLGKYPYYKGKDLVLFEFLFETKDLPDISNIKCESMFFNKSLNIYQPELSEFKYIPIKDYPKYLNYSLVKVFDKIFY